MSDRDARHYELLIRAGRLFNDATDRPTLLGAVRDFLIEVVDATSVSLLWLDDSLDSGRYLLLHNRVSVSAPTVVDPLERRLVKDVIRHREPLLLADLSHAPDYVPRFSRDVGLELGPMAVVPLMRRGRLCGTLEVARATDSRPFSDGESEFLQAVAEDIALAVANADLYDALKRASEENALFRDISVDLGRAVELETLLERILDHLEKIVPYDAAGIYLRNAESRDITWLKHRGYGGDVEEPLKLKLGEGIVGRVSEQGRAAIVDRVSEDPDYVEARPSTRSEMVVPIRSGSGNEERTIGAINLESDVEGAFLPGHLARLEAYAGLAGVAIEREWGRRITAEKERLDQELTLARRIQQSFLPRKRPRIPGFDVWGAHRSSIEMSGDYYDVIPLTARDFGLVMADVSGKGVPAALIMASLRAGLRSEVRNVYAIRQVIHELNRYLVESTAEHAFVTAFYGVLNTSDRSLTYVNAGHDRPLLVRRGSVLELETGGPLLGAFAEATFEEGRIQLEPEDLLVLYTDGLTEAVRSDGEPFGIERLQQVILETTGTTARVGKRLLSAVTAFTGSPERADDQTLLLVRVPA